MTSGGVVVLLYLNIFLLFGLVLRFFFRRLSDLIPYTVLLLAIGLGLGFTARALEDEDARGGGIAAVYNASGSTGGSGSAAGRRLTAASGSGSGGGDDPWWTPRADFIYAIATLGGLDPHLMLYIFLPALLFESANAIDFHCFRKVVGKTVTLAFPCMVLGSFMMASVVRLAYPDWSWDLALLLGTITSATDPVAVVAMLRELGAKVSLSTTIEGESLLNDGSAVVLFNVLKDIAYAGGEVGPISGIIGDFFRMAVLGPIIGAAFGCIALLWCSRVFNDPLVEISISIVTAYLAYYVSEYWIHSSGVLTVVFTGLAFASTFGRTSISPEVFHFLHEFWETLGYLANTIIFLITGVAISYNASALDITSRDIGISFLVYLSGLIIRSCIFVITFPLFTRMPYGWTWQEALIASWGGLRGAVGLALGLDIFLTVTPDLACPPAGQDPNIACQSVQGRILLHTSMMVVCTLVINASTLKPLLGVLKFVELSKAELKMLEHISYRLEADAKKYEVTLQDDPFLSNSNWEIVRQYTYMLEIFKPLLKGTHLNAHGEGDEKKGSVDTGTIAWHAPSNARNSRIDVHELLQRESVEGGRASHSDGRETADEVEKLNLLNELKYQYHMSLKASVWHQQHEGTLGSSATDILVDALNHKLDDKHAVDWIKWDELQAAGGQRTGFRLPPWISRMRNTPILGPLFDVLLGQRLQMWHDIAYGFLSVHEHLEHEVEHWTNDPKLKEELHRVMHVNAEGARRSLIDLQEVLPEVCLAVNTRQAARLMLNATRAEVKKMEDHGQLPGPQAKAMRLQVETQMRKLQLARMPLDLSKEKVLSEVKWIHDLKKDADEVFYKLVHASTEINYQVGEYVVRQGELPTGDTECVFLIARGIVDIIEEIEKADGSKEEKVVARRGSGMVIGEQALLTGAPRANSARACTSVLALGLSHAMLHEAMASFPELGCRLWHRVGLNMAQKLLGEAEEAKRGIAGERSSSLEELQEAASQWVPNMEAVLLMNEGATTLLERKVLLLHGSCIEYRQDEQRPTEAQREGLKASLQREHLEAQLAEQEQLRHQRAKTTKQRRFSAARIFGAGAGGGGGGMDGRSPSVSQVVPAPSPGRQSTKPASHASQDDVIAQTAKNAAVMMGFVPAGGAAPAAEATATAATEQSRRPARQMSVELGPNGVANGLGTLAEGAKALLHNQRRLIHQDSQWIVHIAPCIIDVPTGGAQAKHELMFIVDDCRLCVQPDGSRDSHSADAADARGRGSELDGEPLQFMTSPHQLERDLRKDILKKLVRSSYQPGETIVDSKTNTAAVQFVVTGTVRCDVEEGGVPLHSFKSADGHNGIFAAGEPFVRGHERFLFAPPAGAPLGEWLLLLDKDKLAQRPRVVAETAVTCVALPVDVLDEARGEDKHVETNLWWARCQREAFCYCRKLRPFNKWQPSKLWRWLQLGKHVRVPAGHGLLKETMPFVVLLHGSCHVSYTEAGEPHADGGGAPHRESTGARHERLSAIDGQRRRLGSMVLLGSGARIADLLTFHTHHSKSKDMVGDELAGGSGGGKTVTAPEVIYCHEQIAYHFQQDSLVFIPSDESLNWLPANSGGVFTNGGSAELATPIGSAAHEKMRAGSPMGTIAEGDTLSA